MWHRISDDLPIIARSDDVIFDLEKNPLCSLVVVSIKALEIRSRNLLAPLPYYVLSSRCYPFC